MIEEYVLDLIKDNFMTIDWLFDDAVQTVGWLPECDLSSDATGSNSKAPLFFDATLDATIQYESFAGMHCWCNPVWKKFGLWVDAIEKAHSIDTRTRCLLMVPRWDSNEKFKYLIASDKWRLCAYYRPYEKMFSNPRKDDPLNYNRRKKPIGLRWPVCVFELSDAEPNYEPCTLEEIDKADGNQVRHVAMRKKLARLEEELLRERHSQNEQSLDGYDASETSCESVPVGVKLLRVSKAADKSKQRTEAAARKVYPSRQKVECDQCGKSM